MSDSTVLLDQLRRLAMAHAPSPGGQGDPEAWLSEGLAKGQLHEVFGAEAGDGPGAAGFSVALALLAGATPILWLRTEEAERQVGRLHATGLIELGLAPDQLLLAVVPDEGALLRAAGDAARCAGLGTVLVEAWGPAPGIDLTVTRRLQLAAEATAVTVLLLRLAAQPVPSAAATRWGVRPAPSTALEADAPGMPAFEIELLRRRGGPAGARWRVEWDRDAQSFHGAPLSGAGVSVAADRAAALDPAAPVRRAR